MKHTKVCPKCEGTDILHVHGILEMGDIGNNIYTGASKLTAAPVGRYLCCECGYMEEWLDQLRDIEKIKKRYQPFKWGQ